MKAFREITDQEWGSVEPLLPECRPQSNRDPRGRPMKNRRACMNATLFVMFTGVSWQMLPRKYPSYQTCHRCFKAWYDAGVMHKVSSVLFGNDAGSFLALVAARVRIALRETRGGVDRAIKQPLKAQAKKTAGATKLARVTETSRALRKAGGMSIATQATKGAPKKLKAVAATPAPLSTPSTRRAALAKQAAKAVTKAGGERATRAPKPDVTSSRTTPSAVAGAARGALKKGVKAAPRMPTAVAEKVAPKGRDPVRSKTDAAKAGKGVAARSVAPTKSAKPIVHAVGGRPLKVEAGAAAVRRSVAGERRAAKALAA